MHGKEKQINTKSFQKYLLSVWKYQYHKVDVEKHMLFHIWQKAIQLWPMWKCIYTEIYFSPAYQNSFWGHTTHCVKSNFLDIFKKTNKFYGTFLYISVLHFFLNIQENQLYWWNWLDNELPRAKAIARNIFKLIFIFKILQKW